MALARAGAADEDDVALAVEEGATGKIVHELLVDRRAIEGDVGELLGQRQLGAAHLVADRAGLLLGDLGLQQRADDALEALLALHAGGDDLVVGGPHAGELQRAHHLEDLMPFHGRLHRAS